MNSVSRNYIFFRIEQYLLALPSENILKIVATPPPSQGGMVSMGLVQLQQHSIQILNLEKLLDLQGNAYPRKEPLTHLEHVKRGSSEKNPPFLIVMRKDLDEDLWGIAVGEPPELMNIPDHALSSVPEEIRLPGALQWVSHIATCLSNGANSELSQTLLVLDLPVLLAARRADINANINDASVDILSIEPPLKVKQSNELTESWHEDAYV